MSYLTVETKATKENDINAIANDVAHKGNASKTDSVYDTTKKNCSDK